MSTIMFVGSEIGLGEDRDACSIEGLVVTFVSETRE